jgi:hypothetical protein
MGNHEIAIAQFAEQRAIQRRIDYDDGRPSRPELRADAVVERIEQRERERARHDQRAVAAGLLEREQVRLVRIARVERVDALDQPDASSRAASGRGRRSARSVRSGRRGPGQGHSVHRRDRGRC